MIVASNGMLTGGRVVGHLRNLIGDPNATILFVRHHGVGALGASLQGGALQVEVEGQLVERALRDSLDLKLLCSC